MIKITRLLILCGCLDDPQPFCDDCSRVPCLYLYKIIFQDNWDVFIQFKSLLFSYNYSHFHRFCKLSHATVYVKHHLLNIFAEKMHALQRHLVLYLYVQKSYKERTESIPWRYNTSRLLLIICSVKIINSSVQSFTVMQVSDCSGSNIVI